MDFSQHKLTAAFAVWLKWSGWLCVMLVLLATTTVAIAGDVTMKSGFKVNFEGKPAPLQALTLDLARAGTAANVQNYPITVFDAVSRRYYLPQSQIDEVQLGEPYRDEFVLPVKPSARQTMFSSIGGFLNVDPFSPFGRRIVTLQGVDGPIDVVQAISRITPQYVELSGIDINWQYAVATSKFSPQTLRQVISHAINEKGQEDRFAVARFFVDAEMYREAQLELDTIVRDFPELQAKVDELQLEIRQLRATQFVNEFTRRRALGQYELVHQMISRFPRNEVNQATLDIVSQLELDYRKKKDQIDQVKAGLATLQAAVTQRELLIRFRDLRSVVDHRLSVHTLERMVPFLQNLEDPFLTAEQKLSLAYSAWVVGPTFAETDPETTIAYWDVRDIVIQFLKTENTILRAELVSRIKGKEYIGPEIVAAIVEHLGAATELSAPNGELLQLSTTDSPAVDYELLLPAEFSPDRNYPLVIALHAGGLSPRQALAWWGGEFPGGPAHRNGYITVAPAYEAGPAEGMRSRIVQMLRDVRQRFAVDSDRVFIAGHGSGGDVVFDLAMSHPDLFAGGIIITGETNDFANHYWENARHLPLYVVSGELDGENFKRNAIHLNRMMKNRFDVTLVEYKQRGREDYAEELPQILRWMSLHRRAELPDELELQTMRASDNRFYWLEFQGMSEQTFEPRINRYGNPIPPRPLPIKAKTTVGNTIYLTVGADRVSVWLSPELISFEDRLKIQWKGRTEFNEIPEKEIGTMLEHLRITGDRQRLYWQRVDL